MPKELLLTAFGNFLEGKTNKSVVVYKLYYQNSKYQTILKQIKLLILSMKLNFSSPSCFSLSVGDLNRLEVSHKRSALILQTKRLEDSREKSERKGESLAWSINRSGRLPLTETAGAKIVMVLFQLR